MCNFEWLVQLTFSFNKKFIRNLGLGRVAIGVAIRVWKFSGLGLGLGCN